MTRRQALKAMTLWAARSMFEGNLKGSLEAGKQADFVVTDRDIVIKCLAIGTDPRQVKAGQLAQGFLEQSNVELVEEMVKMIETQRAFELNSKAISKTDEMMRFINNQL